MKSPPHPHYHYRKTYLSLTISTFSNNKPNEKKDRCPKMIQWSTSSMEEQKRNHIQDKGPTLWGFTSTFKKLHFPTTALQKKWLCIF